MGYVDSNLIKNEQVVYRAKLHWFMYVMPVLFFTLGLLVCLVGAGFSEKLRSAISGKPLESGPRNKDSRNNNLDKFYFR